MVFEDPLRGALLERTADETTVVAVRVREVGDSIVMSWSTGFVGSQYHLIDRGDRLTGRASSWSDMLTVDPNGVLTTAGPRWNLDLASSQCPRWVVQAARDAVF